MVWLFLLLGQGLCDENFAREYQEAFEARKAGRDDDALLIYQQVYRECSSGRAAAQVGLTLLALGRYVEAESALVTAFAPGRSPEPWIEQNRKTLLAALEVLDQKLGTLDLIIEPPGGEFFLNDVPTARSSYKRLPTGVYRLKVIWPNKEVQRSVAVVSRQTTRVTLAGPRMASHLESEFKKGLALLEAGRALEAENVLGALALDEVGALNSRIWLAWAQAAFLQKKYQRAGERLARARALKLAPEELETQDKKYWEVLDAELGEIQFPTSTSCEVIDIGVMPIGAPKPKDGENFPVTALDKNDWTGPDKNMLRLQFPPGRTLYWRRGAYLVKAMDGSAKLRIEVGGVPVVLSTAEVGCGRYGRARAP